MIPCLTEEQRFMSSPATLLAAAAQQMKKFRIHEASGRIYFQLCRRVNLCAIGMELELVCSQHDHLVQYKKLIDRN